MKIIEHANFTSRRRALLWASLSLSVIFLSLAFEGDCAAQQPSSPDAALGERLYLKGIAADGAPAHATTERGAALAGPRLGCVACHRASGFGSSEGGYFAPPITGPILFNPRQLDRGRFVANRFEQAQPQRYRARLSQPHMRPGYTQESLARALRAGVDPAGQPLDAVMPRYDLTDADIANLAEYLRGLSAQPDAGVTKEDVHFATIVSADAPPSQRAAMLSTIEAYFEWFNKNTGGDQSRSGFSPYHRSEVANSLRRWRLHVWELQGAPESWPAQLERYYAAQPVFAIVSGLVRGPFQPVAEFCDNRKIPALFPNTQLPAVDTRAPGYVFYLSQGLELEAKGLAAILAKTSAAPNSIVQILGPGFAAQEPARIFSRELTKRLPNAAIARLDWSGDRDEDLRAALAKMNADAIVLWPGDAADEALTTILESAQKTPPIFAPSDRLEFVKDKLPADLAKRVTLAYPYELPGVLHPLSFHVRAWMRTRRLDIDEPRLQFQTYYALSLLEAAMGRLLNDFYRDYLVEMIEQEADGDLNPGVFPSLSLGPGQRVASKGMRIIRIDPTAEGAISPLSDWIVP
jgi:mono/diheme cytochrome c family protein